MGILECFLIKSICLLKFEILISSLKNNDFYKMFMPVHRAAEKTSEAEFLQKVPPHTLDHGKIARGPQKFRGFLRRIITKPKN